MKPLNPLLAHHSLLLLVPVGKPPLVDLHSLYSSLLESPPGNLLVSHTRKHFLLSGCHYHPWNYSPCASPSFPGRPCLAAGCDTTAATAVMVRFVLLVDFAASTDFVDSSSSAAAAAEYIAVMVALVVLLELGVVRLQ